MDGIENKKICIYSKFPYIFIFAEDNMIFMYIQGYDIQVHSLCFYNTPFKMQIDSEQSSDDDSSSKISQQLIQENNTLKKESDDLKNENVALRVSLACIESQYCICRQYYTCYVSRNISYNIEKPEALGRTSLYTIILYIYSPTAINDCSNCIYM